MKLLLGESLRLWKKICVQSQPRYREARARYAPGARYAPPHVFRPTPVGPLEPGTQPAAESETIHRITGARSGDARGGS